MKLLIVFSFLCFSFTFASTAFAKGGKNYLGPKKCIECHKAENKAWQSTHHFTTFKKLHRRKEAKKIAKNLGIKRIKNESDCMQCHYTVKANNKPIAGISCESCHGAGKKWMDVHNDFGGKDVKKMDEKPAHAKMRIAKSEKAGMIRPANLYRLAQNCYECHTVPHEKLVNKGGHKAGSKFELVSWSQGEVRHNYGAGKENRKITQDRKRMMYIVGRMLDLEYGLRGVAEVTKKSKYAVSMAKRTARAINHLKKIQGAISNSAVADMIAIGSKVDLKANNKSKLIKAAKSISKLANNFADANDGTKFAAIDSLIKKKPKGMAME